MMRRVICVGILASAFGSLLAGQASAGFTGASASGPGGTVTNIAIETTFSTDDSVQFDANYTSPGPIDFFLTLNGTGDYFLGAPFGNITNSTGTTFSSFFAYLVSAPAGSTLDEASYDGSNFTNGVSFTPPFPNVTLITFNGPPGIAPGVTTQIGVGFVINASGPQTVEIVLTPTSIPEPSTFMLGVIGVIAAGLGHSVRRFRRQR
jgi:hypothetical protein